MNDNHKFLSYKNELDYRAERAQLEANLARETRERRWRLQSSQACHSCQSEQERALFWRFILGMVVGALAGLALGLGFAQLFKF